MFEQSVIVEKRRPWSVAASFTLQTGFVAAAILLSILHIDKLPAVTLPAALPPLPRAPRPPVEIIHTSIDRTGASSGLSAPSSRVFTEPARIPTSVAVVVDDAPPSMPVASAGGLAPGIGVPGGIGEIGGAIAPPPPPPKPAKTDASQTGRSITIGGKVLEAKLIKRVMPLYPPLARQARVSGTVRLMGVIARDGSVQSLRAESGHPLLVAAALEAVRQWVYSPTLLNGQPVEVIAPIEVHFTLTQ